MKKISVLLILTSLSMPLPSFAEFYFFESLQGQPLFPPIESLKSNQSGYDLKDEAIKFQAKYGNRKLIDHPLYNKNVGLPSECEKIIRNNRENILKTIEEYGINAIHKNEVNNKAANPLSLAALANDFSFAKFLLSNGANPNQAQVFDNSSYVHPIEYAQTLEMVQLFEDNGTDLTPLFNKDFSKEKDTRIAKYIAQKKNDLETKSN